MGFETAILKKVASDTISDGQWGLRPGKKNIFEKRTIFCKWLLGLCVCIVTIGSICPSAGGVSSETVFTVGSDKILHFLAFGLIMLLAIGALEKPTAPRIIWAALCAMLFGVAIEGVQYLMPSRTFNPLDIAADSAGIFAIILAWFCFTRIKDAE